jgi:hypothetical protein
VKSLRFGVATFLSVVLALIGVATVQARPERPAASVDQAGTAGTTLKVTVVLSRFSGEKKILSLPFVLMIVAGDDRPTSVQMSSEVPVPSTSVTDGKVVQSYSYRSLGTNISVSAKTAVDGGVFSVSMTLTDSQVLLADYAPAPDSLKGLARYQSFTTTPRLLLRDGQTIQYAAATDKVSGDVVKVDVTLNVVK